MTREDQLIAALRDMLALHDVVVKSNNVGKMCFQDYALLNMAPMNARRLLNDLTTR